MRKEIRRDRSDNYVKRSKLPIGTIALDMILCENISVSLLTSDREFEDLTHLRT